MIVVHKDGLYEYVIADAVKREGKRIVFSTLSGEVVKQVNKDSVLEIYLEDGVYTPEEESNIPNK